MEVINMEYLVTIEQMRNAESNAVKRGVSHADLAGNAATACFEELCRHLPALTTQTVALLCGKGMNGGDGMLLASLLKESGVEVLCVFVDQKPSSGLSGEIYSRLSSSLTSVIYSSTDSNPNLETDTGSGSKIPEALKSVLQNADIIVDCVYGFGFSGELPSTIGKLFRFINDHCSGLKFSIDLPSGLNADTGEISSDAFKPDVTLVLGAFKKGMLSHPAFDCLGDCVLLNIGLIPSDFSCNDNHDAYEAKFTTPEILALRKRLQKSAHKGNNGRLLNISGSERYIGAALLSTKAAIKTGAGLVTLITPEKVVTAIASEVPEAIFVPIKADARFNGKDFQDELQSAGAIICGCGLGDTEKTRKIVTFVLQNSQNPIILDADGINSICDNINVLGMSSAKVIVTPHPGEFSKMTGLSVTEIQKNRIDYARLFSKEAGVIVVLKGVNTVIAEPSGRVYVNPTGNAGLSKAGTGDVLTGIIGALVASGTPPYEAAIIGVYLHGCAADELSKVKSLWGITASDVAEEIARL
ncbi:MAG: NAD(P)H-hydrate dehydratase [Oscillospiraceae bacterium]|nr:NAD(P)H-hydrate dehydratase [Oscillospiraceae bacterium]